MKSKLTVSVIILAVALGVAAVASPAVLAVCTSAASCINDGVNSTGGTGGSASVGDIIKTVVNVLLYILGAVAVIMIIIGGIKYTTSQGDSSAVTSAKNTILYSVIGLIVALIAYAIVNLVVTSFAAKPATTTTTTTKTP
ncbi:hypothetical protein KC967_00730 [Candidatus Saccharibacteria bacterium]|nr:hypothetical protein [Candidatus Saccharibacteria bacterium]